ncbi:hypothetical protein DL765_000481 [Monosporascus sp. GIB2]|nr:hypothetical protein DL765_000481 [Monosporascus sp. GIB2]
MDAEKGNLKETPFGMTPQTTAVGTGIVAMLTVFGAGFQLGWAPLSRVVAAKMLTTRLRDATYVLGSVFNIAVQFAVSFSIPCLLREGSTPRRGSSSAPPPSAPSSSPFSASPSAVVRRWKRSTGLFVERVPIQQFWKDSPAAHAAAGGCQCRTLSTVEGSLSLVSLATVNQAAMAQAKSTIPTPEVLSPTDAPRRRLSEPVAPSEDLSASFLSGKRRAPSPGSGSRRKLGAWGLARRTLGIALLLLTVFLWTLSNFLASYIFSDHTYDKPFFVVYVNTSIFAISMIPISVKHILESGGFWNVKNIALKAWRGRGLHGAGRMKITEDGEELSAGERLLVDDEGSFEALDVPKPPSTDRLDLRETARLSLEFCMLWFFANYFASACLEYTSVGSVTILTSTSSVWTLIFCAVMKIERFSIRKLVGVLASLTGIVLISMVDLSGEDNDDDRGNFPHKSQQQIAIGDAMALISAVVYGLYVVVMKQRVGNEDRVNMPLFFGLVGIFNIVFLWPLFFILHWTGIEPFEMPPTGKVWFIIMVNSISSFISDMSWAYAMLLTTPLVVTVGLSLTIPLSLIGEMIQYEQYSSFVYWIGAFIVLLSFIFINHESHEEDETNLDSDPGARAVEP